MSPRPWRLPAAWHRVSAFPAILVPEHGNPHDPNAVGVYINGRSSEAGKAQVNAEILFSTAQDRDLAVDVSRRTKIRPQDAVQPPCRVSSESAAAASLRRPSAPSAIRSTWGSRPTLQMDAFPCGSAWKCVIPALQPV